MDERSQHEQAGPDNTTGGDTLFSSKAARDEMPVNAWAIAGLVVLVLVGTWMFLSHHKPASPGNSVLPLDAYAGNLPLSQLAMSESTSLSGGKSTYIDGHIRNTGSATLTGVTVQVFFRNDEAMPPQVETASLSLIRTHEPYIDTEPVSAAPLKPGDDKEFRLIFETLPQNWNTQMPDIHVVQITTK